MHFTVQSDYNFTMKFYVAHKVTFMLALCVKSVCADLQIRKEQFCEIKFRATLDISMNIMSGGC